MIRYDRQIMIPGWGIEGQKKLKSSKVAVIGAGGLGSPVAMYLAAAGVGHLLVVDKDRYELSNLNRQLLGWQKDIGRLKVDAAKEKLEAINPEIKVEALATEVKKENVLDLLDGADLAIDGADNWSVRFIVNEACVRLRIPFIHAGVQGFSGQVTTIVPGLGPCLACIMPRHPPDIERFPVVGATPGLFAMLEAMEALKMIVGIGFPLIGKILIFNGEDVAFDLLEVHRDPRCPICG
ncbi:MAG: HesA/MoeB/ThiF family protein [Thermoproteota archaeon]